MICSDVGLRKAKFEENYTRCKKAMRSRSLNTCPSPHGCGDTFSVYEAVNCY